MNAFSENPRSDGERQVDQGLASWGPVWRQNRTQIDSRPISACCADGAPQRRLPPAVQRPESKPVDGDHGWVVYRDTLWERGFATEQEAERWLKQPSDPMDFLSDVTNQHQGWRGPVPIKRSIRGGAFSGVRIESQGTPASKVPVETLIDDLLGRGENPALAASRRLNLQW